MGDLMTFKVSTAEADFLFGSDIPQYINEIYSRGLKLRTANARFRDHTKHHNSPPDYDHQKVCDEMHTQLIWITEQFSIAKEKFKKYLDISK